MYSYVLDDHDQERQLDSESFIGISWAGDVVCRDVSSHDFEHRTLDVWVSQSLYVTVSDLLVPNLQGLGTMN